MKGKKVMGEKQNDEFAHFYIFLKIFFWTSVMLERYFSALDIKMSYTTDAEFCQLQKKVQDEGRSPSGRKVMGILVRHPPIEYR